MQTVAIEQFGGPELFVEKDLPLPKPSRHEVRIKIVAVGFNPVDAKIRSGVYGGDLSPVLGIDFSGIVDAVGDSKGVFQVGDEVFGMAFGPSSNGSYAEYTCVPAKFIAKKPENLSFEQAAAVPVAYLTAFQALIETQALQKGRPLFIGGGSGGVGSSAIALAKIYQSGSIFTLAGSEASRDYLMQQFQIPKDQILEYQGLSIEKMKEKLIEMNQNTPFYCAMDFVGGEVKELCFHVAGAHGHVVTILPEEENYPLPIWGRNSLLWNKSLSFHVIFLYAPLSEGNSRIYSLQLNHLKTLFEKEGLQSPQIEILGSLSAKTIQEAHKRLESGHTRGKLVMTVSGSM